MQADSYFFAHCGGKDEKRRCPQRRRFSYHKLSPSKWMKNQAEVKGKGDSIISDIEGEFSVNMLPGAIGKSVERLWIVYHFFKEKSI